MIEARQVVPFEDLIRNKRNGIYKKKKFHGSGVKIVNMGELFEYEFISDQEMNLVELSESEKDKFLLKDGDLLFARRSLVLEGSGKCSLVVDPKGEITFESSIIRIRPNKELINPLYYYYYFKSPTGRNKVISIASRTAVSGIKSSDLIKLNVHFPSIEEQDRISSLLKEFDDLIENNTRRITILEEMARLIYREWFVHYRYPGHENDRLVDSGTELGEVPEGWGVKKLKDFMNFKNGKSAKNQEGETYPVYGANGVIGKCDEAKWKNGIIIGRVGAYCGDVEYCNDKFWASDNTIVALPTKDFKYTFFIYYKLEDLNLRQYAGGSAQPLMTQTVIKEIQTVVPLRRILEQFQAIAEKLWNFKRNLEKKNQKLKTTRDLLLPKLISGKVGV